MATAKSKINTYRDLISKTEEEKGLENLNLQVEQAKIAFQQGLLSLKSKLLASEGDVFKQENKVKEAELKLEQAKISKPDSIVQNLIDAKVAINQAVLDLESVKGDYTDLVDLYNFMTKTEKELF